MMISAYTSIVFLSFAAVSSATVEEAAEHVSDGYNYQRELPSFEDIGGTQSDDFWEAVAGSRREGSGPNLFMRSASAITSVMPWIALAVLVGLAVIALGQRLSTPRGPPETQPADEATRSEVRLHHNLPEPNELARSGRFDEAIHALLLHAFRTVSTRLRWEAETSDTSREVVSVVPLQAEERELLGVLVSAVESSRFAGIEANESAFLECQRAFEQLNVACSRAHS